MEHDADGAIVVGVTGRGREAAALRFAAEQARVTDAEVVLAHAYDAHRQASPTSILVDSSSAADVAEWVVKDVAEEFHELTDGVVRYRTVTAGGSPARVLVMMSHGARTIVVQHRRGAGVGRVFVGSTAHGAAAHAACPVVSVNEDWQPQAAPQEVVVGVHEDGGPRQALEAGFDWATSTGAGVRVVHGWRLDAAYDDIISERVDAEWRADCKYALTTAVAKLSDDHPAVGVTIEVRHQWPADVLVDDSRAASLVVVGRHASHPWALERLGSIARTVMAHAESPVMVVPTQLDQPDGWGLTAEEISPQT